ncbi:hypothetical protein RSOL_488390, partial [Rhizoctonia solani AG-3 Rhs1AP]
MRSFAANEVHVIKNGRRRAEGDGAPVVDVLSQGMRQIVHGTKGPIAEFNRNLEQIQKRHDLKPVTEMARDWRASLGAGDGSTEPGEHLPDGLNHLNQPTTSHAAPSSSESQAKPEGDNTRSEVLQEDLDIDMTMEYDEFNYELPSDIDSLFDYHPPSEADYEAELENADLGYWDEEDDLLVAGLEAFEAAIELEDGGLANHLGSSPSPYAVVSDEDEDVEDLTEQIQNQVGSADSDDLDDADEDGWSYSMMSRRKSAQGASSGSARKRRKIVSEDENEYDDDVIVLSP